MVPEQEQLNVSTQQKRYVSSCNLIERALRARLVYGTPNMNRAVSFEYMNRQLVWNEFSEMLLLLLPLLNSSTFKNIFRPLSKDKSSSFIEDDTCCPICQANLTTTFLALPCQHRYCYYCIFSLFSVGLGSFSAQVCRAWRVMFSSLRDLKVRNWFAPSSSSCGQIELGSGSHEISDLAILNNVIPSIFFF